MPLARSMACRVIVLSADANVSRDLTQWLTSQDAVFSHKLDTPHSLLVALDRERLLKVLPDDNGHVPAARGNEAAFARVDAAQVLAVLDEGVEGLNGRRVGSRAVVGNRWDEVGGEEALGRADQEVVYSSAQSGEA